MRTLLETRAAAMARLVEADPARAIALTLPADVAGRWLPYAPPGTIEVSGEWQGEAEIVVVDDPTGGTSQTRVWLRSEPSRAAVHFASGLPALKSGEVVRVRGTRIGAAIAASRASTVAAPGDGCTPTGPQNIAALLVNMPGAALPAQVTPAFIHKTLFGAGPSSLADYWREFSGGKISPAGNVFGPFTLSRRYGCFEDLGPGLAELVRAADSTVDFTKYNRIVVFNNVNDPACTVDYATLGCIAHSSPSRGIFRASVAVLHQLGELHNGSHPEDPQSMAVRSVVHETGHNLGLHHANSLAFGGRALGQPLENGKSAEYGDRFSAMGQAVTLTLAPHFNARHKSLLGWLGPGDILDVETSGTFTVEPMAAPGGTGWKALRVRRGAGIDQYLWIEYRQPVGYDAGFPLEVKQGLGGALIFLEDPARSGDWGSHTQLLDFTAATTPGDFRDPALAAGARWSDPYGTLSLTVNSATPAGLGISVNYENPCARPAVPSVTLASGVLTASIPVEGGCASSSSTSTPWIRITAGNTLSGLGSVDLAVTANLSPMPRVGQVAVAGQTVVITQPPAMPPTVSPASGTAEAGALQQFQATFRNYGGAAALTLAEALFSQDGGSANACWIVYRSARNSVALGDDEGAPGREAAAPVTAGAGLRNSRCSLETASAQWDGNSLTLAVSVRFTPSFTGALKLYGRAWNGAGSPPAFLELGSWRVTMPAGPQIRTGGVVNAASSLAGAIAPGEMITVYGSGLGPAQGVSLATPGTTASGARLLIDGIYAYLTYVSAGQLNALVPYGIARGGNVPVQGELSGVRGNTANVPAAASSPGIFTLGGGSGQARAVNQDGTWNSPSNPAARGSSIAFWATGQGLLDSIQPDGEQPAGPAFPRPSLPVSVRLGAVQVPADHILFAGLVHAGELQVNLRIPAAAPSGDATPLVLYSGAAGSQAGVTVAIR